MPTVAAWRIACGLCGTSTKNGPPTSLERVGVEQFPRATSSRLIYGDEDFELFWLYEPATDPGRFGHLHRTVESAQPHSVRAKPVPPDFPD
jgi:hypothetical protein